MNDFRINNFDLLRMVLALIVVFAHFGVLTGLHEIRAVSHYFNASLAVDGFFVVSGFLVYMSLDKAKSLGDYFQKRLRRIFPAYVTVVVLCAILFVSLSTLTWHEYFCVAWLKYLLSNLLLLNFLHPELPGVFTDHRITAVNGALWTIKIEFMFYVCLPFLLWLMRRFGALKVMLAVYALAISYSMLMQYLGRSHAFYLVLERQLPGQLAFFVSGMCCYHYFEYFKKYAHYLLMVAIPVLLLSYDHDALYPLYPLSLAVNVIYFAMVLVYLGNWGKFGDFSYGIYIWHFPLIQSFISLGVFDVSPWLGAGLTLLCLFAFAYLSWHWVEKPFLQRRSHYRMVETQAPRV